ncbi:hypothetical protein D9615_007078 [Tricholomella constricta]|uniref:Uncharacterized protein n=1 Tax=Tricholomella constricta TaxID=117010 RepID=A0A8H5H878_9AGAR|nr:hypothetical protein D9615_007078 [Tricholomella constricta]
MVLNDSDRSIVFKAILDSGLAVVLKFAADEDIFPGDLSQEAAAYAGFLEILQGSVVPTYYGKYDGECSHGIVLSCIVLEDCGEKVECKLLDLETEERHKVLEQLGRLHSGANRHLVDFANPNVVVKNGEYRLIGFHDDDLWDHECTFDGEWHFGEDIVGDDRTCYALADVGDSLEIWKEEILPCISINGCDYPCVWYPSQKVIDTLFKEDIRLLQCGDFEFARRWLRGNRKHQDSQELDSDDEEDLEQILGHTRKTKPELPAWASDVFD